MAKHIAFSGNTAWGMYNFRGKLLRHMVEEGYRVSVLAPYDDVYSPKLAALGCEMCDMPMNPKGVNPISDANLLYRYYKTLKQLKPDISITYTIKPNIYGSLAARWLGIPYLPITTGLGYVFIQRTYITTIVKWLYKWAFKRARHVWFLNNDDIDTFRNEDIVSSDKIQQLPGEGIDLNRFKLRTGERDATPFVFLLVGRMLMDKGVREYVAAARMLKQKYPDVKFRLLGAVWEGNPATISEEQLREWEREGVVEYYGEVPMWCHILNRPIAWCCLRIARVFLLPLWRVPLWDCRLWLPMFLDVAKWLSRAIMVSCAPIKTLKNLQRLWSGC